MHKPQNLDMKTYMWEIFSAEKGLIISNEFVKELCKNGQRNFTSRKYLEAEL
jgi:hypothetical protein